MLRMFGALVAFCLGVAFATNSQSGVCVIKLVKGKLVSVGDCQKNDGSEIARLMKRDLKMKQKGRCDILYKSKCFHAIVYPTHNANFEDAQTACEKHKWKLGNVYDVMNYLLLQDFFVTMIPADQSLINVWTGMTYTNGNLRLTSGKEATFPEQLWKPYSNNSGQTLSSLSEKFEKRTLEIFSILHQTGSITAFFVKIKSIRTVVLHGTVKIPSYFFS
uniref:uncharacterized protein LOC120341128 n=1 Tax=Styela clava TaxID=7725 RepID=UPI001939E5B2|nr:uncharacterized protein LOC120341128 [Styela clava]